MLLLNLQIGIRESDFDGRYFRLFYVFILLFPTTTTKKTAVNSFKWFLAKQELSMEWRWKTFFVDIAPTLRDKGHPCAAGLIRCLHTTAHDTNPIFGERKGTHPILENGLRGNRHKLWKRSRVGNAAPSCSSFSEIFHFFGMALGVFCAVLPPLSH